MKIKISIKNVILLLLAVLIIVPPFFDGGRHFLIFNGWLIVVALMFLLFSLKKKDIFLTDKVFKSPYFFWKVFLALSVISVIQSIAPYQSVVYFLQLVGYVLVFFIVSQLKFSSRERTRIILLLIITASILSLVGIYYYLFGNYNRLTSTFYWPNPFAGYLLLALPLAAVYFYFNHQNRWQRILALLALPILLTSFLLTQSRGAWLSLLIAVLIYLPLYFKKIKKIKVKWIGTIFLLLLILTGFILALKFGSSIVNQSQVATMNWQVSQATRLDYWSGAIEIFSNRPLFGFGPDTFRFLYPQYQENALSVTRYAHNYFLQLLAENGLLAAIGFILILISIFVPAIKLVKKYKGFSTPEQALEADPLASPSGGPLVKNPVLSALARKFKNFVFDSTRSLDNKNNFLIVGLLIGLSASIIHSLIDFDWHFYANFITFWILAGLLFNFVLEDKSKQFCLKNKILSYCCYAQVIILVLALTFAGAIRIKAQYHFQKAEQSETAKQAESEYRAGLFLNPNPDYYTQLSQVLLLQSINSSKTNEETNFILVEQAEANINKAIKLNSYNPYYYQIRARINFVQRKFPLVEADLQKAIQLDSINQLPIYIDLISFYLESNNSEAAEKAATSILLKYPDEIIKRNEWEIIQGQGAATLVRRHISVIYYFRGLAEAQKGNLIVAQKDFEKALEVDRNNSWAKMELERFR